jgi:hypothetical protein
MYANPYADPLPSRDRHRYINRHHLRRTPVLLQRHFQGGLRRVDLFLWVAAAHDLRGGL